MATGWNDLLRPIPVGLVEFHYLKIFNRWSPAVHDYRSCPGWDGRIQGVEQNSGTYVDRRRRRLQRKPDHAQRIFNTYPLNNSHQAPRQLTINPWPVFTFTGCLKHAARLELAFFFFFTLYAQLICT